MSTHSDGLLIEHLLRRAGFGYSPDELAHYQSMGYKRTLKQCLAPEDVDDSALEEKLQSQNFDFTRIDDLKRWWIYRMTYTKRPLLEKMTLFWHGHFATSNRKVGDSYWMYRQNMTIRELALGNFGDLLLAMSKDPAMIKWLDNQQNRKGKPNENYAREVMELFSVGIGNYTENDIKEAARAFTGWQTKQDGFKFNAGQHDDGPKTFMGRTGNFNGEDIISILAEQDATGRFLALKMCRFFVADEPNEKIVSAVADAYTPEGDNIRAMLKTLFNHPEFRSRAAFHAKIKSPAELVIGSIKSLQVQKLDADLPSIMSRMGQPLFEPASVKGWDGGAAWVSTDTMMERFNFATRITQQKFDAISGYINPGYLAKTQGLKDADETVDYFASLLVDGDIDENTRTVLKQYMGTTSDGKPVDVSADPKTMDEKLRGLVHLIMTLPSYQLA